ncbi:MAG: hypothetical protein IKF97_05630 [Clostridia bacterium]|nr:hypothetical protein [Clostridia bacterium]
MVKEVSEVKKVAAQAEELVKFTFFAKHKECTRKEICGGPIFGTVNINGQKIVVYTILSEADVTRYRDETIFDFI